MKNYYKILGVSHDATTEDIKRAYCKLSGLYNPKELPGDRHIEERFIDITLAYRTLTNTEKRSEYDKILCSLDLNAHNYVQNNAIIKGQERAWLYAAGIVSLLLGIATYVYMSTPGTVLISKHEENKPSMPNIQNVMVNTVSDTHLENRADFFTKDKKAAKKHAPSVLAENEKILNVLQTEMKAIDSPDIQTVVQATYYKGSTKKEVLIIQGTPSAIVKYDDNSELWQFGNSTISFEKGIVASYNNADRNLWIKNF